MEKTNEIQHCWANGFLEGWREQSISGNPPNPTIPAFPGGIPSGHQDECKYAFELGLEHGRLARMRVHAGM